MRESSPGYQRNHTEILVGCSRCCPLTGRCLLLRGSGLPLHEEFHVPWAQPGPELGKISGVFFLSPARVGGRTGGREPFWERVLGSVCVCGESGPRSPNLCPPLRGGGGSHHSEGVEGHQLSLESFLSHSFYQVSWSLCNGASVLKTTGPDGPGWLLHPQQDLPAPAPLTCPARWWPL